MSKYDCTRNADRTLSYVGTNINMDGSVMTNEQIREERYRRGLCVECNGVPIQIYQIKKSRMNPLWSKKIKLTVPGESIDGKCLRCYPHLNPDKKHQERKNRRKHKSHTKKNLKETAQVIVLEASVISAVYDDESVASVQSSQTFISAKERDSYHMEKVFAKQKAKSSRRLLRQPSIRQNVTRKLIREPSVLLKQSLITTKVTSWGASDEGLEPVSLNRRKKELSIDPIPPPPEDDTQSSETAISLEEIKSFVKDISDGGNSDITTDVLIQFIIDYPNDVDILAFCIGKIWDFCKANEDYKKSVISTSAPDDILQAMKTHSNNAQVQEQCCGALWALCNSPVNRKIIIRAGASARIIKAFVEHSHNEDVVSTGLGCLRMISPDAEARETISALSGIDHICRAMKVHSDIAWIQRDGCAFLSNCAVDVEKQQVAMATDIEIEVIINAFFNHPNDASVVNGCCFAIKNFTHEESNVRSFRLVDGLLEGLQKTIETTEDSNAKADAMGILEIFEASESDDYYLENQVLESISLIEVEDYRTMADEKMKQVIGLMEEYGWSRKIFAAILESLTKLSKQYPHEKEIIASDIVIQNILTQMNKYKDFSPIQSHGLELLEEIIKDNEKCRSTIIDMDGSDTIIAVMERHTDNTEIQKAGSCMLDVLSKYFPCETESDSYVNQKRAAKLDFLGEKEETQKNKREKEHDDDKKEDNEEEEEDIYIAAFEKNAEAFKYVNEKIKNNKEAVMAIVGRNGLCLEYACESMKKNRDVVMRAIEQNSSALVYADTELQEELRILVESIEKAHYNGFDLDICFLSSGRMYVNQGNNTFPKSGEMRIDFKSIRQGSKEEPSSDRTKHHVLQNFSISPHSTVDVCDVSLYSSLREDGKITKHEDSNATVAWGKLYTMSTDVSCKCKLHIEVMPVTQSGLAGIDKDYHHLCSDGDFKYDIKLEFPDDKYIDKDNGFVYLDIEYKTSNRIRFCDSSLNGKYYSVDGNNVFLYFPNQYYICDYSGDMKLEIMHENYPKLSIIEHGNHVFTAIFTLQFRKANKVLYDPTHQKKPYFDFQDALLQTIDAGFLGAKFPVKTILSNAEQILGAGNIVKLFDIDMHDRELKSKFSRLFESAAFVKKRMVQLRVGERKSFLYMDGKLIRNKTKKQMVKRKQMSLAVYKSTPANEIAERMLKLLMEKNRSEISSWFVRILPNFDDLDEFEQQRQNNQYKALYNELLKEARISDFNDENNKQNEQTDFVHNDEDSRSTAGDSTLDEKSTSFLNNPSLRAMSYYQLLDVEKRAKDMYGKDFCEKSIQEINENVIAPICKEEDKPYSLNLNVDVDGLELDVFVSNSQNEPFGEFVDKIRQTYQNKIDKPNFWICICTVSKENLRKNQS